jgi:hypothetical protein
VAEAGLQVVRLVLVALAVEGLEVVAMELLILVVEAAAIWLLLAITEVQE